MKRRQNIEGFVINLFSSAFTFLQKITRVNVFTDHLLVFRPHFLSLFLFLNTVAPAAVFKNLQTPVGEVQKMKKLIDFA